MSRVRIEIQILPCWGHLLPLVSPVASLLCASLLHLGHVNQEFLKTLGCIYFCRMGFCAIVDRTYCEGLKP